MKHIAIILISILTPLQSLAYDFEVNGIYYNIIYSTNKTVSVTYKNTSYNSYSGKITIPDKVNYNGVEYSVTSIWDYAFSGCTGLTSVTIPNSVTSIWDYAFYGCTGLTSVTIPNSVTSIWDYAFSGCTSLTSIEIPNSVTTIRTYAFNRCTGLNWIYLGSGIKSIGDYCFYGCKNLNVILNNSRLKIEKGSESDGYVGYYATKIYSNVQLNRNDDFIFIHTTDETAIIEYIGRNNNAIIPSSIDGHKVTSVASTTFANDKGIVSLTIGENVLSIESNALKNCTSLYKLILMPNTPPSGLTSNLSNLEERVTYVANNNYTGSVLGTIRKLDFLSSMFEVDGVKYVPISPSERTCIAIDGTYSADNKDIVIGETVSYKGVELKVTEIGQRLLYKNPSVNSITVSSNTSIPEYFAANCANLQKVNLRNKGDISENAFSNSMTTCSDGKITLNNTGSIGMNAFYGCTGLKTLDVGTTVTSIGKSAFAYAMTNTSDGEIILNNSGLISNNAFNGCAGLKSLNVGTTVTSIGESAFAYAMTNTSDGEIKLNNTGTIGKNAFKGCTGLKTLNVCNTVTDIGDYAFAGSMTKSKDAGATLSIKGTLGVEAFKGCSKLLWAALSGNIKEIGARCFQSCTTLKSVNIPDRITSIQSSTFSYCDNLKSIKLPEGLKTIGLNAFRGSGLESISIPAATSIINDGAFYECKSLARFEAVDGTETLKIGYSGTSGTNMFALSPLKEVTIGRNLSYNTGSSYGYSPFYRNTNLETVVMTDIPTEVFTNEFYGCTALKNVKIGDGVTKIGDYAFSGCSDLDSFTFGAGMQAIGKEAFSDCTSLKELYAEPTVPPTCGTQALDDINKWECKLFVPQSAVDAYRAASQWKEFFFIEDYDFSGVEDVMADALLDKVYRVYNLNGVLLNVTEDYGEVRSLPSGIYIVNGKKVIVK